MVMASADLQGKPQAATVEYVMDGNTLLINTFTYYRKYPNLLANPQVACVITEAENKTLQFDAKIVLLEGDEAETVRQLMIKKKPQAANFFIDETTRFFRISPTWMRLRDYTVKPLKVTELTL